MPLTLPSPQRLYRNREDGRNFEKRDRQTGEETLERHLRTTREMSPNIIETAGISVREILTQNIKMRDSKVSENGCLSLF